MTTRSGMSDQLSNDQGGSERRFTGARWLLASLVSMIICSVHAAPSFGDGPPRAVATVSPKVAPRILEKFDVNHDGSLDPGERTALRDYVLRRLNSPLDRRIPGKEDAIRWERDRAKAAVVHDENRSMVDAGERKVVRERRGEFLKRLRAQIVTKFDENHNGLLDADERAEIERVKLDSRAKALLKYDTNHDGRIDQSERPRNGSPPELPSAPAVEAEVPGQPTLSGMRVLPVGVSTAQGVNIEFTLGKPGAVSLRVFDVSGRLVRTLVSREELRNGSNSIRWDTLGNNGGPVSTGVYLITVEAFGRRATRKVAIVR